MRVLRILGWTMIWAGGLIVAFLLYQLVGTGIISDRAQSQAEEAFAERVAEVSEADLGQPIPITEDQDLEAPASQTTSETTSDVAVPVLYPEPAPLEGEPIGRIVIEKIGADYVFLEGVTRDTLKGGPGHMPWTPLPGQPGNAVISGHRTTYGAPFGDLDQLEPGDLITVETLRGIHVYEVRELMIVLPTDVWVTNPRPGAWLTLTTCNPRFSARERLVVVAEMIQGKNLAYAQAQRAALEGLTS